MERKIGLSLLHELPDALLDEIVKQLDSGNKKESSLRWLTHRLGFAVTLASFHCEEARGERFHLARVRSWRIVCPAMGIARGFWSYVHRDDEGMHGAIRKVAEHLQDEYGVITGDLELDLFYDGMKLKWGDKWRSRVREAIEDATFFIPIITPRYFKSEECRNELSEFAEQAKGLGREGLVMPLYFVPVPELDENDFRDPLVKLVADSQMKDWRTLRFLDETTQPYRRALGDLATRLVEVAGESGLDGAPASEQPIATADEPEAVTGESSGNVGSLEQLVSGEEALPRMVDTLENISGAIEKVGTLAETAAGEVRASDAKGGGFKGRLVIANRLAEKLTEPADDLERLTSEYVADLIIVDPAMKRMIKLASEQAEADPVETSEFYDSVETMISGSEKGSQGIGGMVKSLNESGDLSRELNVPLKRLRGSLQSMIDANQVMDTWKRELEEARQ